MTSRSRTLQQRLHQDLRRLSHRKCFGKDGDQDTQGDHTWATITPVSKHDLRYGRKTLGTPVYEKESQDPARG